MCVTRTASPALVTMRMDGDCRKANKWALGHLLMRMNALALHGWTCHARYFEAGLEPLHGLYI